MSNPTAGIGDPYWYEWSVGHKALIDMLNPDNGIKSVTYQSKLHQGWDDVVVEYVMGNKVFYQVKHTREQESLTFGDLISKDKQGESLLSYLAKQWKTIDYKIDNKFVIFTNKSFGTIKHQLRPPLSDFWRHLKQYLQSNCNLTNYSYQKEFDQNIQEEWFSTLSFLSAQDVALFLSQLEISANQINLDELEIELIDSLSTSFGITKTHGNELLKSLDHALRKWATSAGMGSSVTVEDVYAVLQKNNYEEYGDHQVTPPKPFFTSRKTILARIKTALSSKENKVVFLSGLPGIGKTSLISELIRDKELQIHLRYYTFKPISPDNDLLPTDAGKACEAINLWCALLSQLRIYFTGELFQYKVPLRNEFLPDVNAIRSQVIRLAKELCKRENQRIVICIDGIDHAARANIDSTNYLNTLLPPDNIPDELIFLIAGQPVDGYEKYPNWLKTAHPNISHIDISNLPIEDIELLLSGTVDSHNVKPIATQISEITKGNTLSTIYAVEAIRSALNIEDAINSLHNYRLKDGLNEYYAQIWNHALASLQIGDPAISVKIASYFSLTKARLEPSHFRKLIPELALSNEGWDLTLSKLKPLLKNENGYAVLHNDIKVFLTKLVSESKSAAIFQQCAHSLLQLIFQDSTLIRYRYFGIPDLLEKANDCSELFHFFNSRYLLEYFENAGARSEFDKLIQMGLDFGVKRRNTQCVLQVLLVIKSLYRLDESLQNNEEGPQWHRRNFTRYQFSELRVLPPTPWNLDLVNSVLYDILQLFRNGYSERADMLLQNWFGHADSIHALIGVIADHNVVEHFEGIEDRLSQNFQHTLNTIGRISIYHPVFHKYPDSHEMDNTFHAYMDDGFENEAALVFSDYEWIKLTSPYKAHFVKSFEERLIHMIVNSQWRRVIYTARNFDVLNSHGAISNVVYAVTLISQDHLLKNKWSGMTIDCLLGNILGGPNTSDVQGSKYFTYCATALALGIQNSYLDVWDAVGKIILSIYGEQSSLSEVPAVKALLKMAFQIGSFLKEVIIEKKRTNFELVNISTLISIFHELNNFQHAHLRSYIPSNTCTQTLMELLIKCVINGDVNIQNTFSQAIKGTFTTDRCYSPYFRTYWKFLYERGELETCQSLLNNLIGENGKLWGFRYTEKFEIYNELFRLIKNTDFEYHLIEASKKVYLHRIGFSEHKDYSLYSAKDWFDAYVKIAPDKWREFGISLLILSEKASDLGDNRANNSIAKSVLGAAIANDLADAYVIGYKMVYDFKFNHALIVQTYKSLLQTRATPKQTLIHYWILACSSLYLHDYNDRKELIEIKSAILDAAYLADSEDLERVLKELFPTHFHIDRITDKESSQHTRRPTLPFQDFDCNLNWCFQQDSYKNELLIDLIHSNSYLALNYSQKKDKVALIYSHLLQSIDVSGWKYDGIDQVYYELFPLIDFEKRWAILERYISAFYCEDKSYLYSLEKTIDRFCLNSSLSDSSLLKDGLANILKLHCQWLSSFDTESIDLGNLEMSSKQAISDFSEFVLLSLLEKLTTRSGIQIEAACNGIARMIQLDTSALELIITHWPRFTNEQIDYLLQIFEIIVRKQPVILNTIMPFLKILNENGDFLHRSQIGLVKLAHSQVTNSALPTITTRPSNHLVESLITLPNSTARLHIQSDTQYVSQATAYYTSKLSILSSLVDLNEDQEQYLRNKIAHIQEKSQLKPSVVDKSKLLRGDFIISDRLPAQILGEVFDHELAHGIFQNFDPILLSQVLLCNDDPVHFLEPYKIHPDPHLWPQKYSKVNEIADDVLLQIINCGIEANHAVLAAELKLYPPDIGIVGLVNTSILPNVKMRACSTFNGRSIFTLYDSAFHPDNPYGNLFIKGGGMSKFLKANNWLIPDIELFNEFDCQLSPSSPTTIIKDGEKVAWLEKYFGPESGFNSNAHHQSELHRWVCLKSFIDDLTTICSAYTFFKQERRVIAQM